MCLQNWAKYWFVKNNCGLHSVTLLMKGLLNYIYSLLACYLLTLNVLCMYLHVTHTAKPRELMVGNWPWYIILSITHSFHLDNAPLCSIGQCNTRVCPQNLNSPECEKLQWPKIWRCFEASSIISMQDLSFVIYTAAYLFDRVLLHDTCATENKDLLETSHTNLAKIIFRPFKIIIPPPFL